MLRQGRFRHRLLDPDFLRKNSGSLHSVIQDLKNLWHSNKIQDVDFVALYLLLLMSWRRPQDFLGGPHNFPLPSAKTSLSGKAAVELLDQLSPQSLNEKTKARLSTENSLIDVLCSLSWRSIPFATQRALASWAAGTYPLKLLTHIPSSEEVLSYQCHGSRCVSVLCKLAEIQNYVEDGRDVLGFVIHDLIHADHFFHDRENALAQIQFSRRLQKVHRTPMIQDMIKTDSLFAAEWNYLISDMNSVPLHLLMTLKATLLGFCKRQASIAVNQPLPEIFESKFVSLFSIVLEMFKLSSEALTAAHRLNTPLYLGKEDSLLLAQEFAVFTHDSGSEIC